MPAANDLPPPSLRDGFIQANPQARPPNTQNHKWRGPGIDTIPGGGPEAAPPAFLPP